MRNNRKVCFRAKGNDEETKNRWFYGSYYCTCDTTFCFAGECEDNHNIHHYILYDQMTDWGLPNRKFQADIEFSTLGQYTNKNDKKGHPIYEDDVVQIPYRTREDKFLVVWDEQFAAFWVQGYGILSDEVAKMCEVVGNIIDNPEYENEIEPPYTDTIEEV